LGKELGVQIVSGVSSREHVHMLVEIPPHIAVGDVVRRVKGRSSHRVRMEFPNLRKRTWGRYFWARDYFCTRSGNITDAVILPYPREHEPTGVGRWLFSSLTKKKPTMDGIELALN
jgi:putative transposase